MKPRYSLSMPMTLNRRTLVMGILSAAAVHRAMGAGTDVAWRFVQEDLKNVYKPLPQAVILADCKWLQMQIAQAEKRLASLGQADVDRFKTRIKAERPKLQAAIKSLEQSINSNNKQFYIEILNTAVGVVLAILGVLVVPEAVLAVGALVGVQLLAGVGFSAWSLIENPNSGAQVLVGYGRDKTLTLVGIVLEQSAKRSMRLLAGGLAVLGPVLSAMSALEASSNASSAANSLKTLRTRLSELDTELGNLPMLDDKKLLTEVLKPIYSADIAALKAFVKETEPNNCQITQGPIIKRA